MRRMVKEHLLKFDGTPLFPERIGLHRPLQAVRCRSTPVQGGDRLCARGIQPRRLAGERQARGHRRIRPDHPAAAAGIFARGDLPIPSPPPRAAGETAAREELLQRGGQIQAMLTTAVPVLDQEDIDDLDDAPDAEVEETEEKFLDQATAARTIAELAAEIETLKRFEALAQTVRRSGTDTKWRELATLLDEIFTDAPREAEMFDDVLDQAIIAAEAGHLHRAPRHAQLPGDAHLARCSAPRGRRHDPWRHGPRGTVEDPGVVSSTTKKCRCCWRPTRPAKVSTCSVRT